MVGFSANERQLSNAEHAAAGALSGVSTRIITQPLDVLKIRFQLQVEPIARNSKISKYKSIFHSIQTIAREETLKGFWKGHVCAQVLTAVYMAVEFTSFELFTKALSMNTDQNRTIIHFISGGGAGAVATVVSYPFDVIRTRFIAQGTNRVYTSLYSALRHIYISDGFYGYYRGLWFGLVQTTPQSALHFGFYECYKQMAYACFENVKHDTKSLDGVCGFLAGFTSKLIVYPFDTGKRRLQVIGFSQARTEFGITKEYSGSIDFLNKAIREEGIKGYYKGASFALLKSGVTTAMYFYFYEMFCSMIRHNKYSESS